MGQMKLWKLEADAGYDEYEGFVVLAETEAEARALAHKEAAVMEHPDRKGGYLDSARSTCELITFEGESRVVLSAFRAG